MPFNSYRPSAPPVAARTHPAGGSIAPDRALSTQLIGSSSADRFSTPDHAFSVRRGSRFFRVTTTALGAIACCGDVVGRGDDVDSAVDACVRAMAGHTSSDFVGVVGRVHAALGAPGNGRHEAERQGCEGVDHQSNVRANTTAAKKEGSR
jgi:hypothetical protein